MALDGVPWFIGGPDAEHGPEVARMLAYLAANGNQGVVAPDDLKVTPLDVPGAGVKVLAGGASILNALASQEAYTVRNPTADTSSVQIAATGSAGGRTDVVIARVDNPNVDSNAQEPADPVHGPYDRFDVIPGVPAGTTRLRDVPGQEGTSGIELARIDLPANTGTVTSAMITDLRRLANPRTERQVQIGASPASGKQLTSTNFTAWPTADTFTVAVPDWATHMIARLEFVGAQTAAQVSGQLRLILGASTAFGQYAYNMAAQASPARETIVVAGEIALPDAVKGSIQPLRISGMRDAGKTGYLYTVDSSYFFADVEFVQRAV